MSGCAQCGMWVDPKKPYHPYAACLMFMGCKDGNTVQANLDAVVAKGAQYDSGFDDMADTNADMKAALNRIDEICTEYLSVGGLFNPELMEHEKVGRMVQLIAEISRAALSSPAGKETAP